MASREWAFRIVAPVAGVLTVCLAVEAGLRVFGVDTLDEVAFLEQVDAAGKRPTPLHPNEEGHRIAAQHLFETLRDRWQ